MLYNVRQNIRLSSYERAPALEQRTVGLYNFIKPYSLYAVQDVLFIRTFRVFDVKLIHFLFNFRV